MEGQILKGFRRKTWGRKEERGSHVQGGLIMLKMI
jgi:hypothetical protein